MKPKFKRGEIVVNEGSQGKTIFKIDKVWSMKNSKDLIKSVSDGAKLSIDRFYTCDKAEGLGFEFVNGKFLRKATKQEIKEFAVDIL